jgi:hypothetical protein
MQGLGIRLAKAVNRVLGRRGKIRSDRYHCRALRTPREVRNTLIYVLLNGRKHHVTGRGIDPCSSGAWFSGWKHRVEPARGPIPVHEPEPGFSASAGAAAGRLVLTTHPRRRGVRRRARRIARV